MEIDSFLFGFIRHDITLLETCLSTNFFLDQFEIVITYVHFNLLSKQIWAFLEIFNELYLMYLFDTF